MRVEKGKCRKSRGRVGDSHRSHYPQVGCTIELVIIQILDIVILVDIVLLSNLLYPVIYTILLPLY